MYANGQSNDPTEVFVYNGLSITCRLIREVIGKFIAPKKKDMELLQERDTICLSERPEETLCGRDFTMLSVRMLGLEKKHRSMACNGNK
jgi:hypothetical protein